MHTKLEVLDESLRGKLRLYALLAPHMARQGAGNSGWCSEIGGNNLLHAERKGVHLVMGCSAGFSRRSVGYVGASDGWQDLMKNFKMDWEFRAAGHGNIALTGEIVPQGEEPFTVAIAFGRSCQSTVAKLLQSLAEPFEVHREAYVRQWQRTVVKPKSDFSEHTSDGGHMYRLSRCILLAHEDKTFQGALVASMSIPWGETKGDNDLGGYHLVWTRDLVQSATALLATGQTGTPLRALIWLAAIQRTDGRFPQNSWINGNAYWSGVQLDEIAAPILLAWRLHREGVTLGRFDPCVMISRAAAYLIRQGPVTAQERWEENAGYSPSTLATVIAGLVCAAEFAKQRGDSGHGGFYSGSMRTGWPPTLKNGPSPRPVNWSKGSGAITFESIPRILRRPIRTPIPNTTMLAVANGGGVHPARNVVGGDFLHLVRLGIRAADDPLVRDSIAVMDRLLKRDLPQGPCWRRYNHDGYGQKDDGSAFDGTGRRPRLADSDGRARPLRTRGGTRSQAVYCRDGKVRQRRWHDQRAVVGRRRPAEGMRRGLPTGAAMPLCWSHAEYVSLVRSAHDGVCFDRVEPAFQRYVVNPVASRHEIWSFRHPLRRMPPGKILRLIVAADATVVWSADDWASTNRADTTHISALNVWFADLPTEDCPDGSVIEFTFFWKEAQRWEGRNYSVAGQRTKVESADDAETVKMSVPGIKARPGRGEKGCPVQNLRPSC